MPRPPKQPHPHDVPIPRGYLTVAQAAVYLGLPERNLRLSIAQRQIPFKYWGKRRIILSLQQLDAFVEALDGCTLQQALDNVEEASLYAR